MLELPESYFLSKQISDYLTGKTISQIEVLHTPHRFAFMKGDIDTYEDLLVGKTIVGARQIGGMLKIDTSDSMIVFTDGATLRLYKDENDYPKKHQFSIYFEDGEGLFMTVRMYAVVYVCPKDICDEEYYLAAITKPSPLSDEFDYDYFRGLYSPDKKISVKAFLATEQRIPGLGNGVLQDILWDAQIDPRSDMSNMDEDDFKALFNSVKKILKKMCDDGGRDTESDIFGNKCGYISQLSKNSYLEPCIRCGSEINKANYMGGTIYFCPKCQKRI